MNLAVCVDDRLGLRFGGRRQSKDSAVRKKLLELSGGSLRMNGYSARQFAEPVYSGPDWLTGACSGDWCFAEDAGWEARAENIETLILFRWNRHYPADEFFRFPGNFTLLRTEEFPGSGHDKITMEVYQKSNA